MQINLVAYGVSLDVAVHIECWRLHVLEGKLLSLTDCTNDLRVKLSRSETSRKELMGTILILEEGGKDMRDAVTTLEQWRIIIRDIVYWVNIDAASKAYHLQTITDETVAGGVSILGTGLRITDCKGHCQDVIIGAGVLPAGQSSAEEFAEVMRRSTVTIGNRTVTVPHIKVFGGISDNAKGAVGVTNLYGSYKAELVSSLSDEMMEAASDSDKSVWQAWHQLRCEMHKIAL